MTEINNRFGEALVRTGVSRRTVLRSVGLVGGALVAEVTMPGALTGPAARAAGSTATLHTFIKIMPDGAVMLETGQAEMGQGVHTGFAQILADELGADWSKVSITYGAPHPDHANPWFGMQLTGGSMSVRAHTQVLRQAAAGVREMLTQAAADRWGVDVGKLTAANGAVTDPATGDSLGFGELAEAAAALTPPAEPGLKDSSDFNLIGKSVARLDTPSKTNGTAQYGIDVRVPGMAFAAMRHAPVQGATVATMNKDSIAGMAGVVDAVEVPGGVTVVADSYWRAKRAVEALEVSWTASPGDRATTEDAIASYWRTLEAGGLGEAEAEGDVAAALAAAATVIEADYEVPFLAHATMEPMNATAHVTDGRAEVWAPHQSYDAIIGSVAGVLGIDPADVTLHTTMLGGGFGRRFEMDFAMQAAVASKAVGRPVQLIWSREEDIRHDWFRPAMVCRLRAGLDASGAMTAFSAEIVGPSVMLHTFPDMIQNGVDPTTVEGLAGLRYAVPNRRVAATLGDTHLNIGFWRSVGHSHNGFFSEGFIDEVAVAAGADPYRFRRTLLAHDARAVAVLDAVAEASGWDTPPPEGRARGIAFHESFGSLVAEVAEVSVERGRPRVHRVWVAIDPGQVINPQQIEAQMHSGVVYGLTAALRGEITFDQGQIVQSNFHDYTPLRMDEMPEIDVTIVVSGAELGGVGEPATPPIAPAVVNALAALTGRRLRSLPLSKHQIEV